MYDMYFENRTSDFSESLASQIGDFESDMITLYRMEKEPWRFSSKKDFRKMPSAQILPA